MRYYIKDKVTSEFMRECYESGFTDEEGDVYDGPSFLLGEDNIEYASDYPTYCAAEMAVVYAEEDLEDYEIVEIK